MTCLSPAVATEDFRDDIKRSTTQLLQIKEAYIGAAFATLDVLWNLKNLPDCTEGQQVAACRSLLQIISGLHSAHQAEGAVYGGEKFCGCCSVPESLQRLARRAGGNTLGDVLGCLIGALPYGDGNS